MKNLLAAVILLLAAQTAAAEPAGFRGLTIPAEHHGREMSGALWYPSAGGGEAISFGENGVFYGTEVLDGARMAEGPFPVILASHGLGGHIGALGWLTAGLAEAGALVLSVNHPGSTRGDFDLQEGLKHWTRTEDLRAALDWLAARPDLAAHADFARIYAVGFSAGGWTALSLGGARASREGYAAHCETAPPSPSHCADLARRGADLEAYSSTDWNAGRKDDRIRAVTAIDPALTYGLGKAHARDLVARVLLIGLGTAERGSRRPTSERREAGSPPFFRMRRSRPWPRRPISRRSCRASRVGRRSWPPRATIQSATTPPGTTGRRCTSASSPASRPSSAFSRVLKNSLA